MAKLYARGLTVVNASNGYQGYMKSIKFFASDEGYKKTWVANTSYGVVYSSNYASE